MDTFLIVLASVVLLALAFFIGSGIGYNIGLATQNEEADKVLEQAKHERKKAKEMAVTARRSAGDL